MDYETSLRLYSKARMNKYACACHGDKAQTMLLYRYNIKLCQRFYGVLNLFEIILRNAVNVHYAVQYDDRDWIVNQAEEGKLLSEDASIIKETEVNFRKHGIYSNDKMVASFTLGFWTFLFTKKNYKKGGKTLLKIFPCKARGKNQAEIYRELTSIREFRNRIAHHEPICFDAAGRVSTAFARRHYQLICNYIEYFGLQPDDVLQWVERPEGVLDRIDRIGG